MKDNSTTIAYYEQNAESFSQNTVNVNMSDLYQYFLPLLPSNAHILDVGCGSGRDSQHFIKQGYRVTAFDGSESLVNIAEQLINQPVYHCFFEDFTPQRTAQILGEAQVLFDGIWACASLLHASSRKLPMIFKNLAIQLSPQGKLYCSFKYGSSDREVNGRYFTNANEERLSQFISNSGLKINSTWLSSDLRPGRDNEFWLNAILSHANG